MPPPLELALDNSPATILTLGGGEAPLRNTERFPTDRKKRHTYTHKISRARARDQSIGQWCESVNDPGYETSPPSSSRGRRIHTACSDVNDRLPLVQVNRLKRAYTHANLFARRMTGKIGPRRSDATQGTEDICDVHLERTHLKPGVKGEDWELHQHAQPAIGPARHTACGLVTYRRYVSRTHSPHLVICDLFSVETKLANLFARFPPSSPCVTPRIRDTVRMPLSGFLYLPLRFGCRRLPSRETHTRSRRAIPPTIKRADGTSNPFSLTLARCNSAQFRVNYATGLAIGRQSHRDSAGPKIIRRYTLPRHFSHLSAGIIHLFTVNKRPRTCLLAQRVIRVIRVPSRP